MIPLADQCLSGQSTKVATLVFPAQDCNAYTAQFAFVIRLQRYSTSVSSGSSDSLVAFKIFEIDQYLPSTVLLRHCRFAKTYWV